MARDKRKKKDAPEIVSPTPEQMNRASYELGDVLDKQSNGRMMSIGKAYRRVPMIDTLRRIFSEREWKALHVYRHHAMIADKSPVRDSLNMQRHGGGGGSPTVEVLNAVRIVRDCENAAGSLADILRAVAVDDLSLSEWAMKKGGSVEQCRDRKGRTVCTMEPRRKALEIAQMEIRIAAQRVEAELAA